MLGFIIGDFFKKSKKEKKRLLTSFNKRTKRLLFIFERNKI